MAILDDTRSADLLRAYRTSGDRSIRNEVVTAYQGLAATIAHAYDRSSEPFEDRFQVALLGVVKAAERFDPDRGTSFLSYVSVTVRGELRRHFRDHGWAVRVPRRLQELRYDIRQASDYLTARDGSSPTPAEVAGRLGVTVDDVVDALCADQSYRARSIDDRPDDSSGSLADRMGGTDAGYDRVEADDALTALLRPCTDRLQRVARLRYVDGMKQSEIADELGISQVHVSRLLAQAHRLIEQDAPSLAG